MLLLEDATGFTEAVAMNVNGPELHHRIRTALHHIIGYSEILLEDVEAQGRFEILPILRRAHGGGKSKQAAVETIFSLPGATGLRPRDRQHHLRRAGNKMVGTGHGSEHLARADDD